MLETLTPIPLGSDGFDEYREAPEERGNEQALSTSRAALLLIATLLLSGALLELWSRLPL